MPVSDNEKFKELMQCIRNQDYLVHKWMRLLLLVQSGIITVMGFFWKIDILSINGPSYYFVALAFPLIAVASLIICCEAAISDLKWQGKFIIYVKEVLNNKGIYADSHIKSGKLGRQAKLIRVLEIFLAPCWGIFFIITLLKWWGTETALSCFVKF